MAASAFIVGYVLLWIGWSALVGAALAPRRHRTKPLGLVLCGEILGAAMVPVVALSLAAYRAVWIPPRVVEMLSLVTPLLMGVFVVQQLHHHAKRLDALTNARTSAPVAGNRAGVISSSTRSSTAHVHSP
jgi:hypothetical protein